MFSKSENPAAPLQPGSQESAPIGEPPPSAAETARDAQPAQPLAAANEAPTSEPSAPATTSPASPTARFCANCDQDVETDERGCCAKCRRFLPSNTAAMVHGLRSKTLAKVVDAYRVSLIDDLMRERGGRDAIDVGGRIAIENYALVAAQQKTIEARLDRDGLFTATGRRRSAFDMLRSVSDTLDRLRAALPPIVARNAEGSPVGEAGITRIVREIVYPSRDPIHPIADAAMPAETDNAEPASPRQSPAAHVRRAPRGDPELWVHGTRLVTIGDVERMFADCGEQHIFERGDFDRDTAFRRAARWLDGVNSGY